MNQMNYGKEEPEWTQEVWDRIDQAVHDEAQRTKVAAKFLPLYMAVPGALIVPADTVNVDAPPLTVDEALTTSIVETLAEFALTKQQYGREDGLMTAITLATRATNLLSQAEDLLLFQGDLGLQDPLFTSNKVRHQSGSAGGGLLSVERSVSVPQKTPGIDIWGENTFGAVATAYSILQDNGHYGPYALVLPTVPYADTYAPLPTTLILTADRIKPLVTGGFYGTGTLPDFTGIMVSTGGNTMDLVVGKDATTQFEQKDARGRFLFRVYERFALRLKDKTAGVKLEFVHGQASVSAKNK
jgi:uncharacterized linocin/CFP29 family protein